VNHHAKLKYANFSQTSFRRVYYSYTIGKSSGKNENQLEVNRLGIQNDALNLQVEKLKDSVETLSKRDIKPNPK